MSIKNSFVRTIISDPIVNSNTESTSTSNTEDESPIHTTESNVVMEDVADLIQKLDDAAPGDETHVDKQNLSNTLEEMKITPNIQKVIQKRFNSLHSFGGTPKARQPLMLSCLLSRSHVHTSGTKPAICLLGFYVVVSCNS